MAKARKPAKNEGTKPEISMAVVLHQKICLSIDMDNRRIYGYTELEILVPDSGIVGLHAENLEIERVSVDGSPTEFDVFPHYQPVEIENRWCSVSSVSSAADAAGATYLSALQRELVPNLLILCCKSAEPAQPPEAGLDFQGEEQSNAEPKKNVRLVRIDYWVPKAETGIHFDDNVLHTDNQIRRAHCWFPCMDDCSQRCCYDMEFTVPQNFVAVSNGSLLYQVLTKEVPPRKTYVYKLTIPVSARWISLAVAPFEILPDSHNSLLSYMCLPDNYSKLQNTVGFFHCAFRHYESYLKGPFPFGSYKQVFIPSGMVISAQNIGASMCIISSEVLFDEKVIDQTIETRIRLANALARQWFGVYITPETHNDEWLVEGLAGFLTDTFIKEFLGNNEARYRRYKANCAVCKADDSGVMTLSSSASSKDLYGTQLIGLYRRLRLWKSVAVLQMLEKQMGPDLFKGILRTIVSRAQDTSRSSRTLSTKEFRQFANKFGNLERPFLKEFFHRWVGTCGCPLMRMGFSYNKRKNLVELAAFRECTATPIAVVPAPAGSLDSQNRDSDGGWPGMMTIKVHELDGTHDHLLPMSGDAWQLLEIKCHSRLAAKRFQKPKKSSKPEGSDDNGDSARPFDMRISAESPLLWLRADPVMEYLAEIHFNQPVQMWINQLEKDKDVVAQAQAVAILELLPNFPFAVVNVLNNFITDTKAFWRLRIEAAFALAKTASEETDWAGMLHLVKFYKSKRFDTTIGLPKPNDFHDFVEYFVLEAIPQAIATVRTTDKKSPKEAVELVLQLLKSNDNTSNPYSDVFWLSALVDAVGELEFGRQSILLLPSFLKRIDRILQFERLMPSYNNILAISCIRTLTRIALKLSEYIPLERATELIMPFLFFNASWEIRIEARIALLDLEFYCKGIDAALLMFIKYLEDEASLRGQAKLGLHLTRLCQIRTRLGSDDEVKSQTLVALLRLLEGPAAFCNVSLRHHIFCILQVLAGRHPTLYGIPRVETQHIGFSEICSEQRNNLIELVNNQDKPSELSAETNSHVSLPVPEAPNEPDNVSHGSLPVPEAPTEPDNVIDSHGSVPVPEAPNRPDNASHGSLPALEAPKEQDNVNHGSLPVPEALKEADNVSPGEGRRLPLVKITVKQPTVSGRADEAADNLTVERSHGGCNEIDLVTTSSLSVDAPERILAEAMSVSNQNLGEVNSCNRHGSQMSASVGSAKFTREFGDGGGKELQCTADSSNIIAKDVHVHGHATLSLGSASPPPRVHGEEEKVKKRGTEKKRKRDRSSPGYLEKKRLKKERKKEKERAKLLAESQLESELLKLDDSSAELLHKMNEPVVVTTGTVRPEPMGITDPTPLNQPSASTAPPGVRSGHKLRIKIKSRTVDKP
ncbi:hypothetical protein Dimus_034090 [Dionaea muscipula]